MHPSTTWPRRARPWSLATQEQPLSEEELLRRRVAELEASLASTATDLASTTAALAAAEAERDKLRRAYETLKADLELIRRRLYVAKAERVDTKQLELDFAVTQARLHVLEQALADANETSGDGQAPDGKASRKPRGRRDLASIDMPEERIEITDPALEGVAERIDFEVSCRLGYRRGGPVRIVIARAVYKTVESDGSVSMETASKPNETYERGILAPSFVAHILTKKYRFGMPFARLAQELESIGIALDDSTMGRYAEHVGATLGCIVDACVREARETAFCLSTDATGVAIKPEPIPGKRQACLKGHFFVVLADRDHVFFEYQAKHTSDAVCSMFRGFRGYIQADAHSVYEALFRGEAVDEADNPPSEVGCWAHARRKFWEAAVTTKDERARETLLRIRALFKFEEEMASLSPKQRHERRQRASRPLLLELFAWAEPIWDDVRKTRGTVSAAFGYLMRQREPLCRFLDDGRLRVDNNASERALRTIATGRKAWLFCGSDDHASAAANIFSLIASCRLHSLDPETYLAEIIRVLPYWPRDRYLDLAPKYWASTRAQLDSAEFERELGHISVPPFAAPPAEK